MGGHPRPGVGDDAVEPPSRSPAQHATGAVVRRHQHRWVAGPPRGVLDGGVAGGRGRDRPQHLEHGAAAAGAEVERPGRLRQTLERGHMRRRQIAHVNVVAHAGAVGRGVVVAEDLEAAVAHRVSARGTRWLSGA